mmetsp:Transcript_18191/g.27540  ORF Transcript_18191/g.27540 Transcript_18191/m.27540 type:complete len:96 (-) Transcript_18191:224-511(-)
MALFACSLQYHISFTVGLTASSFGLGATISNVLGQIVVEKLGHVASLSGSLILSIIPVVLFAFLMPETLGMRGNAIHKKKEVEAEISQRGDGQIV